MLIIPVPLAPNTKSASVVVVDITLLTILTAGNIASVSILKLLEISKFPVNSLSPVCVTFPMCVTVPVIPTVFTVESPSTEKS